MRTAIATKRRQHVAGEALRVDAHERGHSASRIATDQSDGFFLRATALETIDGEAAITRGEGGFGGEPNDVIL